MHGKNYAFYRTFTMIMNVRQINAIDTCKYTGSVNNTFIFSLFFVTFTKIFTFWLRGVKDKCEYISFCNVFVLFLYKSWPAHGLTKLNRMEAHLFFFRCRMQPGRMSEAASPVNPESAFWLTLRLPAQMRPPGPVVRGIALWPPTATFGWPPTAAPNAQKKWERAIYIYIYTY